MALQTIPSRQLDQGAGVSLITIGTIHGGTRRNIIPGRRGNDRNIQNAECEARQTTPGGGSDEPWKWWPQAPARQPVSTLSRSCPITYNDPDLAAASLPTLLRLVGKDNINTPDPVLAAEDFAFYQEQIPGLFLYLGVGDPTADPAERRRRALPTLRCQRSRLEGRRADNDFARRRLSAGAPIDDPTFEPVERARKESWRQCPSDRQAALARAPGNTSADPRPRCLRVRTCGQWRSTAGTTARTLRPHAKTHKSARIAALAGETRRGGHLCGDPARGGQSWSPPA